MKVSVTYINHNCFLLKETSRIFLFDYPDGRFLTAKMREIVTSELRDARAFIFASHGHQDHFNPEIASLAKAASQATLVLSDDIIDSHPQFRNLENCLIVKPQGLYETEGIKIKTFPSNDLGVAYLIQIGNLNVYFGGDLAKWSWDDFTPEERRWMEDQFQKTIKTLAESKIDIAFENTDQRLANWAGAAEFIDTVKPALFVPMHTFGKTGSLKRFVENLGKSESKIFLYRKVGEQINFEDWSF